MENEEREAVEISLNEFVLRYPNRTLHQLQQMQEEKTVENGVWYYTMRIKAYVVCENRQAVIRVYNELLRRIPMPNEYIQVVTVDDIIERHNLRHYMKQEEATTIDDNSKIDVIETDGFKLVL